MAGLVVIDFIDMENSGNNRKVERAMKEALKSDRARIQVGRISGFGLFEMSRQRLRTGMLEASTRVCHHCEGTGFIRTASSSGLQALRLLEEEASRGRGSQIRLRASQEAALYVLNRKRPELAEMEERYGVLIDIVSDGTPEGARMTVESGGPPPAHAPRLPAPFEIEADEDDFLEEIDEAEEPEIEVEEERRERSGRDSAPREGGDRESSEGGAGRRRRRRRRRGGRREDGVEGSSEDQPQDEAAEAGETVDVAEDEQVEAAGIGAGEIEGEADRGPRRGRRGRRGGRRGAPRDAEALIEADAQPAPVETPAEEPVIEAEPVEAIEEAPAPRRRRGRKPKAEVEQAEAEVAPVEEAAPVEAPVPAEEPAAEEAAPAPRRRGRKPRVAAETAEVAVEAPAPVEAPAEEAPVAKAPRRRRAAAARTAESVTEAVVEPEPVAVEAPVEADADDASDDGSSGPRRGWWQRTFGA